MSLVCFLCGGVKFSVTSDVLNLFIQVSSIEMRNKYGGKKVIVSYIKLLGPSQDFYSHKHFDMNYYGDRS